MNNNFATTERNRSLFMSLSCSTSYLTSNNVFVAGDKTGVMTSSPNIFINSLSFSNMPMCITLFFLSILIPRKVFLFPLTTDKSPKCLFISSMMFVITYYVDDNKSSYKNPAVITNIIEEINKKIGDLSVLRGKKKPS